MPLLYAGIDEAGYGPLLGPLCVAVSVVRVEDWAPGDPAPDLWKSLSRWVARSPAKANGRVCVADSKKLKLSNALKTKHPLTHLEMGVLSFLRAWGHETETDDGLFACLGVRLEGHPWYAGDPTPLPLANDPGLVAVAASRLAAAEAAGVRLMGIRCTAVGETAFNKVVRDAGSKAAVTAGVIAELARMVAHEADGDTDLRIVCDRQSGRADYQDLLLRAFPGAQVVCDARSQVATHYTLRVRTPREREIGVLFQTEAEDQHFPVALASMTAKLVRELAMARFNRYWCARCPELKPTAGYRQDGARFLRDLHTIVTPTERATMVRMA